jgi:hypothetical protein
MPQDIICGGCGYDAQVILTSTGPPLNGFSIGICHGAAVHHRPRVSVSWLVLHWAIS